MTMEKYLRDWRQEAHNRNQHDTAIFVADKLLALTSRSTPAMPYTSANHGCRFR
jgi:anaphase-promoting complex subunit 6